MTQQKDIPQHIAIIMDGNGRWAQERNLSRTHGHLEGVKRVEEIVAAANKAGIQVLTLFAFSTENWSRPVDEVSLLMKTMVSVLDRKMKELNKAGVKFRYIGRRAGIPHEVRACFDAAETMTCGNPGMTLNIAINYGGRSELVDAVKEIVTSVEEKKLSVDDITETTISQALYTKDLPDPDLLIRTSGEKRISNFLLWQLSYAELFFTEKCWPDFNEKEFQKALDDFKNRERRYGNIVPSKA